MNTSTATATAERRTRNLRCRRRHGGARVQQREALPPHRGEDRQREPEMRGEAELRHPRIVDEPALHHVPAHRALQPAEHEDAGEPPRMAGRNAAPGDEPQQRQQERRADHPAEQAVEILPPEDALERGQAHPLVHLLVLRRRLVLGEGLLPLRVGERRQRADDRLPLGDREPRVREASHAADDDHREHQRAADEQPCRHGAVRGHPAHAGLPLRNPRARGEGSFACAHPGYSATGAR